MLSFPSRSTDLRSLSCASTGGHSCAPASHGRLTFVTTVSSTTKMHAAWAALGSERTQPPKHKHMAEVHMTSDSLRALRHRCAYG
jgi:hypothetical protein